jgi:hypothetical protein
VILNNLFAFTVVFIALWLNMAITRAIAGIWLDDGKAKIAAFAFALGSLAGFRDPVLGDGTTIGSVLGMIAAYSSLWWVHFGRDEWEASHG